MKKNQKDYGHVEIFVVILVIVALLGVFYWIGSRTDSKTSTKPSTTPKTDTSTAKPSPFTTTIWAGHLKYSNDNNKPMTSVGAEWNVASVTPADSPKLSATWIGIGGYEGKDPKGLIQIGTDSDAGMLDGGARVNYYDAFWECYPDAGQHITDFKVSAGDKIQANIKKDGANWAMTLDNKTNGQKFQKTVPCNPESHTAEWILEKVTFPGKQEADSILPQLGVTTFSNITANGSPPGLPDMIQFFLRSELKNDAKKIASPSDLSGDGSSFTISDNR